MTGTEDMIETLTRMWGEGHTATPIAEKLGVSRNAVIGKAFRLGLEGRRSPVETNDQKFERMIDHIADFDVSVKLAAQYVGMTAMIAEHRWAQFVITKGPQYSQRAL